MVESVRLIEKDEVGVLERWLSLVEHVEARVLPNSGVNWSRASAMGCCWTSQMPGRRHRPPSQSQLQSRCRNVGLAADRQTLLRIGIAVGAVLVDRRDIYGRGVNLAARLTTLAGPGEIVVSAEARDRLTPTLDAEVEDLGECYVKHIEQPVRAYRIGRRVHARLSRPWPEPARCCPRLPSFLSQLASKVRMRACSARSWRKR